VSPAQNASVPIGLALDPNFAANHYVYVFYTALNPVRNRVVRYTESSGSCTQETPLLDGILTAFDHNSDILQFGPDGKLYISNGDFNGGKIHRVVLSGADLAQLGSSSIVYNGGNGFLLSLMVGADGFVYASNETTIFKVVVTP
jgi:glucose/arabinose dehydrogenase